MPYEEVGTKAVFDIGEFQDNVLTFLLKMNQVKDAVTGVSDAGEKSSPSMLSLAGAFSVGQMAANLVEKSLGFLTNSIGNMAQGSYAAVSSLQNLQISLESLAAKEIKSSEGLDDISQAMSKAQPMAQNLLGSIRDLSVASPFEYEKVVEVFRMNMAFGIASDTAMGLTQAILDMSAASGMGQANLQRLSYNFGQMARVGKISTRDVRDLAMAGVDLSAVLRDELGLSIDQVNQKLESGEIQFRQISEAFINYAEKNFGGASERMSKSLSGLASSFKDVMYFANIDLFGGTAERAGESLAKLFDKFNLFIQGDTLKTIGYGLELVTDTVFDFVDSLIEADEQFNNVNAIIPSTIERFGGLADSAALDFAAFKSSVLGTLQEVASQTFDWGLNIVGQLAAGIIEGATTVLVTAMNAISGILSYWLAPGSPPRVAKDITSWGMSAMSYFLKGFTEADFSALSSIQSPIQSALSALTQAGQISQEDSGKIFAKLSLGLSKAMDSGNYESIITKISKSLGPFGSYVADLTRKELALASATEAVTKAQEALDAANTKVSTSEESMLTAMDEYNKLLTEGASDDVLAAKRTEYELAKQTYYQSIKDSKVAKKDLDIQQSKIDSLKKESTLQEKLVSQLLQISRAQATQPETAAAAGAAGAKKKAGGGAGAAIQIPDVKTTIENQVDSLKTTLQTKFDQLFAPLRQEWQRLMIQIGPDIENFKQSWDTFTTTIQQFWNERVSPVIDQIKMLIPPEFATNVGWAIGILAGLNVVILALAIPLAIITGLLTFMATPLGLLILGLAAIKTWWDENGPIIMQWLTDMQDKFNEVCDNIFNWIMEKIIAPYHEMFTYMNDTLIPKLEDFWGIINDKINKAIIDWRDYTQQVYDKLLALKNFIVEKVMKPFEEFRKLLDAIRTAWNGIVNAIKEMIKQIQYLIDVWIPKLIKAMPSWLIPGSPTPFEIGIRGISDAMNELSDIAINNLSSQLDQLSRPYSTGSPDAALMTKLASMLEGSGSSTNNDNYNLTINTLLNSSQVVQSFETMRLLRGSA